MKRTLTLKNNFHNTEVNLKINLDKIEVGEQFELTPSQRKKAYNTLCGIKSCTCGGILGERSSSHEIDGKEVLVLIEGSERDQNNTVRIENVF